MDFIEVCAKNLKIGDELYLNKSIYQVVNHYNHDIQVKDLKNNTYCYLLGNSIYKQVIKKEELKSNE